MSATDQLFGRVVRLDKTQSKLRNRLRELERIVAGLCEQRTGDICRFADDPRRQERVS